MGEMPDDRAQEYVEPQAEPTARLLRQMIVQNHDAAESGHRRIRNDYRAVESRVIFLEGQMAASHEHFARIESMVGRPVEASTLRFTPQMVFAIVAVCGSVITGQYLSGGVTRADVAGARADVMRLSEKVDALGKLQDERAGGWTRAVSEMKAQQQLLDLRVSNLKDAIIATDKQRRSTR